MIRKYHSIMVCIVNTKYAEMINFYNMAAENDNYLSYMALGHYYTKTDR